MTRNLDALWPQRVIDFEASSLEDGGYPIEVGVTLWPARDAPAHVWSSLIRPDDDWRRFGHWSKASRKTHGIAMSELETGAPPRVVAQALNEMLGEGIVWCDGGSYDAYWLRRLYAAAAARPTFMLGDWHGLLRNFPPPVREGALAALEAHPPRHRAAADAAQLVNALAAGLGVPAVAI